MSEDQNPPGAADGCLKLIVVFFVVLVVLFGFLAGMCGLSFR